MALRHAAPSRHLCNIHSLTDASVPVLDGSLEVFCLQGAARAEEPAVSWSGRDVAGRRDNPACMRKQPALTVFFFVWARKHVTVPKILGDGIARGGDFAVAVEIAARNSAVEGSCASPGSFSLVHHRTTTSLKRLATWDGSHWHPYTDGIGGSLSCGRPTPCTW